MLFGEPTAVSATAIRQRKTSRTDDAFDVFLEYPWLRATLKARIIAYAPGPNLLIHGTGGSFIKYGMDPQEAALRGPNCPDGLDWGENWGLEPEENWGTLSLVSGETRKVPTDRGDYRGFYANVRDVIEKELRRTLLRSSSSAPCARLFWRTRAAANGESCNGTSPRNNFHDRKLSSLPSKLWLRSLRMPICIRISS